MEFSIYLAHLLALVLFVLVLVVKLIITLFGLKNKTFQEKVRRKVRILDWFVLGTIFISGAYLLLATKYLQLYHILKLIGLAGLVYFFRYFNRTAYVVSLLLAGVVFALIVTTTIAKPTWGNGKSESVGEKGTTATHTFTELEKGKIVFERTCAECHGIDGKLGRFGAIDLTTSKLTNEERSEVVNNGRALTVMRAFKNELSPSDIVAVINYVSSLNGNASDK